MFIFNLWYACVILYICTRTNCKKLCIFMIFLHLHRFTIFLHLDSSSVAVLGSSDENSLRYLLCPSDENSSRYFLGSSDENSLRYFLGPKQLTLFLGPKTAHAISWAQVMKTAHAISWAQNSSRYFLGSSDESREFTLGRLHRCHRQSDQRKF